MAFAVKLYSKACSLGNGEGCELAGAMYLSGDGIETDFVKAGDKLLSACDHKRGDACFIIASEAVENEDYAEALTFFDKACDLEDGEACIQSGLIYLKGQGLKRIMTDQRG